MVREGRDQVRESIDHFFAGAEFGWVVKVGHVRQMVRACQWTDVLLVYLVPNVGLTLQGDHVVEARSFRNLDRSERLPRVFVADVFDEEQNQQLVFVLACVHPAA